MLHRSFVHLFAAWLFIIVASFGSAAIAEEEYTLKAAFIVNFTKFVEWPGAKSIVSHNKIDFCVLGDSDIMSASQIFKQASTAKLSIDAVREKSLAAVASHCHMVFISASEGHRLEEIIGALKKQPVLTISDLPDFAEHGGMMGFVVGENRVKFEVNKGAAEMAGLHVDSQLLEIALRVIDK